MQISRAKPGGIADSAAGGRCQEAGRDCRFRCGGRRQEAGRDCRFSGGGQRVVRQQHAFDVNYQFVDSGWLDQRLEVRCPLCLIVRIDHEFDQSSGEWRSPLSNSLPCCLPALSADKNCTFVLIPCIEREWSPDGNRQLSRKMLPLVPAWGITIHKSQGATLARALLSVGSTEKQLGLFFVAVSRVRGLQDLAFMSPMNGDRLSRISQHASMAPRKRIDAWLASLEDAFDVWILEQLDGDVAARPRLQSWFRSLSQTFL